MATTIKISDVDQTVDVDGDTLWVLRDVLGMTGTKFGCGMALCGACTVHVDGVATRSCITTVDSIGTSEITTIEAIGATAAGAKIQKAWLDREVVQCHAAWSSVAHRHGAAGRRKTDIDPALALIPLSPARMPLPAAAPAAEGSMPATRACAATRGSPYKP